MLIGLRTNLERLLNYFSILFFFLIPVATSPAEIAGILLLIITILTRRLDISRIVSFLKTDIGISVLIFVSLHFVGLLWTSDFSSGISFARRSLIWIYSLVIFAINPNDDEKGMYIIAFMLGLFTTSLIVIAQSIGLIPSEDYNRGFVKHITLSVLLAFGIWIATFAYRLSYKGKRYVWAVLMLFYLTALMLGIGRIGFLILVIGMPFIISNILGKIKLSVVIPTALILIVTIIVLSPTLDQRIKAVFEDIKEYKAGNPNTSVGLRLYMWDISLTIIKESPIYGHGTGSFGIHMQRHRYGNLAESFVRIIQPHNSLLYMMTSFGIFGLISFFMLFFFVIKRAYRKKETFVGHSIFVYSIVLLLSTSTDNQMMSFGTSHLFALFTGMLLTLKD